MSCEGDAIRTYMREDAANRHTGDRSRRTRTIVALIICAVALLMPPANVDAGGDPVVASLQDFPPGFRIDRADWETSVEPGQSIQIENLHGDVRARRNEIPRLDVFAVIQLQDQDTLRADVQIVETAGGLNIDVRYVAKDAEGQIDEANEQTAVVEGGQAETAGDQTEISHLPAGEPPLIRRVDLVAYIPVGSPLSIRTIDGLIEARRVKSDVVAESMGGDITVITEGLARAKTSTGSILSVLLFDAPGPHSSLQTDTGDIRVQIPDDLNIRVRARTSGLINSEYPPVGGDTESAGTHESIVQVGAGTHEARIDSDTGNIDISAWRRSGQGGAHTMWFPVHELACHKLSLVREGFASGSKCVFSRTSGDAPALPLGSPPFICPSENRRRAWRPELRGAAD